MTERTLIVCVLAGGSGTRLYPASRSFRPKPLLSFDFEHSLLEQTLERVTCADKTIILTRDEFREDIETCITDETVLTEPASKDTGPALAYLTWKIQKEYENSVIISLPSDHYIKDNNKFSAEIERAAALAVETDKLVTLGIDPARPATEYGYILPKSTGESSPVRQFLEKPDEETAKDLIEDGALWNAGIFAWTPERFLEEAAETPLNPLLQGLETSECSTAYDSVEPISVDYAVLERSTQVYTTRLDVEWDDLGTWDAIGRVFADEKTDQHNISVDMTNLLKSNASNNVIAAPDKHVSIIGVDGLVVAAYDDRILVAPREKSDEIRSIVANLRDEELF